MGGVIVETENQLCNDEIEEEEEGWVLLDGGGGGAGTSGSGPRVRQRFLR